MRPSQLLSLPSHTSAVGPIPFSQMRTGLTQWVGPRRPRALAAGGLGCAAWARGGVGVGEALVDLTVAVVVGAVADLGRRRGGRALVLAAVGGVAVGVDEAGHAAAGAAYAVRAGAELVDGGVVAGHAALAAVVGI